MRRLLAMLLVLAAALTMPAFAADPTEPGETTAPTKPAASRAPNQCGEALYWNIEGTTLTVSGSGRMDDYYNDARVPWADGKDTITALVLEGVTYVGAYAFTDFDKLESVDFGDELVQIGTDAFAKCGGLTEIFLPKTFKIFGEGAFQGCSNLTKIHCAGVCPAFRQNCLWGVYGELFYPAERAWKIDLVLELEEAFHYRIDFKPSEGEDPAPPTEAPTEAPTEPPTEPPTEAPTAPPTEAPTEAPTQPVTEVPTTPPTELPTEGPTEYVIPEPVEKEPNSMMGILIILLAALFLTLCGLIAALASRKRRRRYRGGKYRR